MATAGELVGDGAEFGGISGIVPPAQGTNRYALLAGVADNMGQMIDDVLSDRPLTLLPEMLRQELLHYLGALYQAKLSTGRALSESDHEYLKAFLLDLIEERNLRAREVASPEITEAARLANGLLPYAPYGLLCIDGRVTLTNKFGIFGGMKGGSIQLPAGDSSDFQRGTDGKLFLRIPSNLQRQVDDAIKREQSDTITELLDSHLGCAARGASEADLGHDVKDAGLMADIVRKKEIAEALQRYVTRCHPGKRVLPIQGAFDPHTGYAYAGLETERALAFGRKKGGFSDKNLAKMVQQGMVISTKEIAREYGAIFERYWNAFDPKPNWKEQYIKTAQQFWAAMNGLRSELLVPIKQKLQTVYSDLEDGPDLDMRAMLLLANTLSGFCNNHDGEYQFSEHEESFVSVTPRDYRPFKRYMGFGVYDADYEKLGHNVVFAAGIVRKNRAARRVPKDSRYRTRQEFTAAPVPVVVKEVLRDESMTPLKWDKLQTIDWSFLQNIDWLTMRTLDFINALDTHNKDIEIGIPLLNAILILREKMMHLYNDGESGPQLIEGHLVALPVVCDKFRGFRLVIPFFLKGFTQR